MKTVLLIFVLFVGFNIARYLVNIFKLEAKGVKTYKLTTARQLLLFFYALLSGVAGSSIAHSAWTYSLKEEFRITLYVLAALLLLLAGITFALHVQYLAYQKDNILRFDPSDLVLTHLSEARQVRIRRADIASVRWVKCAWPKMVWGEYEYLVLHLHNGNRLLLTSLLLPFRELSPMFVGKEVRGKQRFICWIKKDF